MVASDANVLAKILTLQNLLHVAPDLKWLGEVLTGTLLEVPGLCSAALYINQEIVAKSVHEKYPFHWPASQSMANSALPHTPNFSILFLTLETANQKYGQLALALDDQDLFEDYLPYIENTLNIVSLIIENQEQEKQLTEFTHKLEKKVADQVQEISTKQKQLTQLFEEAIYGIALADPITGVITDCNAAFADLVSIPQSNWGL